MDAKRERELMIAVTDMIRFIRASSIVYFRTDMFVSFPSLHFK